MESKEMTLAEEVFSLVSGGESLKDSAKEGTAILMQILIWF